MDVLHMKSNLAPEKGNLGRLLRIARILAPLLQFFGKPFTDKLASVLISFLFNISSKYFP